MNPTFHEHIRTRKEFLEREQSEDASPASPSGDNS